MGALARVPDGQVAPGVRVGGLQLGGRSLAEARAALETWAKERNAVSLTLRFDPETGIKRVWNPPAEKLGLSIDIDATLASVGKAGREGVLGQVSHWISGGRTVTVTPQVAVDAARLNTYLTNQIGHDIARRAERAKLVILSGGGFGVHHERPGIALDHDASAAAVTQAWTRFNSGVTVHDNGSAGSAPASPDTRADTQPSKPVDPAGPANAPQDGSQSPAASSSAAASTSAAPEVVLSAKLTQADVTAQDLEKIDGEIADFSTYYTGTPNRRSNVALAARRINGTLLRPGEIFSYNKVVGPRSDDAGFLPAPQYVNGKHVMGEGGGICQVSSTLFNAALLSNLRIVQRHNHSMPVGYLKHGRDATAVYGALDMQFQNNTDTPVYIRSSAGRGILSFVIFGKKVPDREVSFVKGKETIVPPPVETHHDPHLRAGRRIVEEKGSPGISVVWYRVVKEHGEVVNRESFHSHYTAFPTIVAIGSKGAIKPPPAARAAGAPTPAAVTTPPADPPAPSPAPGQ